MPETDVERQFVIDLPNRANQSRESVRSAELFLIEEFRNGTHDPFRWSFDDQIGKDVCALITRKLHGVVQMNGPPVPTLRYYGINACTKAVVPIAVRQQNTKFGSDTGTGLILKRAWPNNVFEGDCRR